jgi:ubiquinone biosynthesis protein
MPAEEVKKIISQELDESSISEISLVPMAAASIGQVHEAKLPDGQEVVIKIRRPGLNKIIKTDLEILAEMANQVERHLPFLDFLHPGELVAEFKRSLNSELNFQLEAVNIERFGHYYRQNPEIKIPALVKRLCNPNVIVMEKITGIKINDLEALRLAGIDPTKVAKLTSKVAMDQIINFGFFHADPHPGNVLVMPGPVLGFLDFGLIGTVDRKFRDRLLGLALGIVSRNVAQIVRNILRLTKPVEPPNREALEMEVGVFIETYLTGSIKDIKIGNLLKDMLELLKNNGLKTPSNLHLLVKALSQLESLGLKLDPDFEIIEEAKPVVKRFYLQRYSPSYWASVLNHRGLELAMTLESLPDELSPLYSTIKSGRLPADLTIKGLDRLNRTLTQSSYRLAFAIVLASLVIGSSLVIHSKLPPLWHGLPIIGLVGFLGAAIVGFWLVLDLLRKFREL